MDLDAIVASARRAQAGWAARSVPDRADAIRPLKRRILSAAEHVAEVVAAECGKPMEEALLAEVLPNADVVDYWTSVAEELLAPETLELDPLAYPGKIARVHRDPRGVVALIVPWNYPVAIPLRTIVPALVAGNAVVLKPSEVTPRSGELLAAFFEGLLPEGLLQVVQGGPEVGAALVRAEVDAVVFTGSVQTGRKVAVACAERLIPCSLELGGKDAAIVLDDAPLERTARGLVWAAFTNAGQNCASVERVYAVAGVADQLVQRVVERTADLVAERDLGKLTTDAQAGIVRRHLEEAVAGGAEVLAGGVPAEGDRAIAPTVLRVKDEACALLQEETFGPVLPIVVVADEDEAVARVNASRYGLTASVWTKRVARGHALASRLRVGVVTINNHGFTAAIPSAPWSGVKETGLGVTNGPHALGELVRPRLVLEDKNAMAKEVWWYPYTTTLRRLALAMATLRGGGGILARMQALLSLLVLLPKRLLEK